LASGRTRALLYVCDCGAERAVMTRLRRRPRAVYRVYGEEEYLAGVDTLSAREDLPLVEEPTHGRRLQRIAGAAALTGAVGTVGGVVGLAGLRMHAVDRREMAQRVMSPVRAVPARGHTSTPAHMARRRTLHPIRPRRVHAHRRTAVRLSHGSALRAETAARTIAVSAPRASAAQQAPAEAHARPQAQSEFGFER
jgi:hypothetical protein